MNPAANLILIGPMGAGKSCIGRRLAQRFGMPLIDIDREIERGAGASVAAIFDAEGEEGFRARETLALGHALGHTLGHTLKTGGSVVATGGGAVLAAGNRDHLQRRGFVVHLHVSVAEQLQRLRRDTTRPLLAREDREDLLQAMAALRTPLYALVADLRFDTDHLRADHAERELAALLQQRWQRCTPATVRPGQAQP